MKKNAIISVYDKRNLLELAKNLISLQYNIYSTSGTSKFLKENGLETEEISNYTGFPEILNGRVKTLHPKIFAGILAKKSDEIHIKETNIYQIKLFDLVVVNLYPFEETATQESDEEKIIENIDIGGISLIRAAAKNYKDVSVLVDPNDYNIFIEKLKNNTLDLEFRKYLATKAFLTTSMYDSIISQWFLKKNNLDIFNFDIISLGIKKVSNLRYGENPHQKASLYKSFQLDKNFSTLVTAEKLQGKELSYNNYLDIDSALNIIKNFSEPCCVIIKHNNPCGVAEANNLAEAYLKALSCDPVSAFGGIVALNREVDTETAKEILKIFTECVIAPGFTQKAQEIFSKKPNLILISVPIFNLYEEQIELKQINGGFLVQTKDLILYQNDLNVVTKKHPTQQELKSLIFAYKVAKYVKSNSIVLAKGTQTLGIGAGQMSRIDAFKIASLKINQIDKNVLLKLNDLPLVLASDAFFPFSDIIEEASKINVSSIIQPGGSIRDEESIKLADKYGISMVFTGTRHFKH